jgi:MarR-like DNA-binding transcriptional regulator SgrR of sgrS sRNA
MNAKKFEGMEFVGVSRGYQNTLMLLRLLKRMHTGKYAWTAYDLAPMLQLSPQHINRLLRQMFKDEKVEFRPILSKRGNPGREWWAL